MVKSWNLINRKHDISKEQRALE